MYEKFYVNNFLNILIKFSFWALTVSVIINPYKPSTEAFLYHRIRPNQGIVWAVPAVAELHKLPVMVHSDHRWTRSPKEIIHHNVWDWDLIMCSLISITMELSNWRTFFCTSTWDILILHYNLLGQLLLAGKWWIPLPPQPLPHFPNRK